MELDSFAPDNPVVLFTDYYQSLAQDDFPDWSRFDLSDVPSAVVPYIALGDAVFSDDWAPLPDHFVYSLEGAGVRELIGRSMVGDKVGYVMRQRSRNSLLQEIAEALQSPRIIASTAELDLVDRPRLSFARGLFLFKSSAGLIERLVLILYKMPDHRHSALRRL
jgi:hypothetical protein